MHRPSLSVAVFGVLSLAFVPPWGAAEDAPKKVQRVFVEVCVAEVSVAKLRALGFDWGSILESANQTDDEAQDLLSFVDTLAKDNLARILCHPQLTTISGRTASFHVSDAQGQGTRLDVVPQVLDTQKIQLQFRIDLTPPKPDAGQANDGPATRQLVLDTATELEPGKTCCISETRARHSKDGKMVETATLVLVRADVKLPAYDREAAKRLPVRGYREVPKRR